MFHQSHLVAALLILFLSAMSSPALGDWVLNFEDDFDDGTYLANPVWVVGDPYHEPDLLYNTAGIEQIEPGDPGDPGRWALRGVGSGSIQPVNAWIWHSLELTDVAKVKFEISAKTSGSSPSNVNVGLMSGMDYYNGHVWANTDLRWIKSIGSDYENIDIGNFAEVGDDFYTYAWWRDMDGWWSFSISESDEDKSVLFLNDHFAQDQQLTAFDKVVLDVVRDGSYIDWVKVYTPEPASLALLGGGAIPLLLRRRR